MRTPKLLTSVFMVLLASLLALPLVAAQYGYGYYDYTVGYLYQSYFFRFMLVLLFFFLISYVAVKNVWPQHATISASLAMVIAFLITGPVLENFEEYIIDTGVLRYGILVGAIIGAFFLVKVLLMKLFLPLFGVSRGLFRVKLWMACLIYILAYNALRNPRLVSDEIRGAITSVISMTWLSVLVWVAGIILLVEILRAIFGGRGGGGGAVQSTA